MNIYDIKNKANEVLRQPNQLFKVILYVGIIQALFSALSGLFDGNPPTGLYLLGYSTQVTSNQERRKNHVKQIDFSRKKNSY